MTSLEQKMIDKLDGKKLTSFEMSNVDFEGQALGELFYFVHVLTPEEGLESFKLDRININNININEDFKDWTIPYLVAKMINL